MQRKRFSFAELNLVVIKFLQTVKSIFEGPQSFYSLTFKSRMKNSHLN